MSHRCLMLLLALACGVPASLPQAAETPLDELLSEVRDYRSKARKENRQREQRFLAERALQQKRLEHVKGLLQREQQRSERLQQAFEQNEARLAELNAKLQERSGILLELFGHAKQAAGDAQAILRDSLIATQYQNNKGLVAKLAGQKTVPSITDLEALWFALQQEMTESGKVVSYQAPVIGQDGLPRDRRVTRVGVFNAVSEGHYLRYLPETGTLREMPRQPGREHLRLAAQLENAAGGLQPMTIDPSRGAVLGLLMQTPDLLERVQQGKAVGYVIIVLALAGGLLALERLVHLSLIGRRVKKQLNSDEPNQNNPLGRVIGVYHDNPNVDTGTLELLLDETVLKNLPKLHRGLPTLKILAAVAPLLGLLGTVVGLIETFQSITLFGTGDPKLMAGGISQALVTTVLGLSAAIPLILMHSGLSSKSHRLVSVLEEQSAGIVARHAETRGRNAATA
jgi:biopolymer transport protein ExbB